ncbi:MAG: nucleotidyltransferase domain-containing protein, partial [Candidatus Margulisiibacteriota bacterium]
IGKTTQWQLNAEHWLANKLTPLILLDALAQADLLNRIKKSLGQNRRIIKAFLFGSLAKKTETPDSDIDLLIIVKSAVDKQNVESAINQLNDRLIRFYGNTISPVIYTQKEYSAKKTSSLINQIKEDQIILVNHA